MKGLTKKGLVYVVDNHRVYRDIIKMTLEQEGYSVRLFEDGNQALKAMSLNKAIQINVPDLIITEMEMRGVDGLNLFDAVNSSPDTSDHIPFIFLNNCSKQRSEAAAQAKRGYPVLNKRTLLHPLAEMTDTMLSESCKPSKQADS